MSESTSSESPQAFLVGADFNRPFDLLGVDESLDELGRLAETAGLSVIGRTHQRLNHPDPATFIRSGKVEEVRVWVDEMAVDIVLFDDELSPRHQRELEKVFGEEVRVLDRTELILDIFAQHAHTREGSLQVQLAQYEYRLPRLTRQWTHLARQAGGGAARGGAGGVGLRGPGETQLETDRREIRRRIAHLKDEIQRVREHRARHRQQREASQIPTVALVGYTNAGKSTMLNRLTGATTYTADQLFATLDPTVRRVDLPGGRAILLTDTVGFIQKLPTTLIAAFRATLEEVNNADLLVHVVDVSHPNAAQQLTVVEDMLANELNVGDLPIIIALNKIDRLPTGSKDDPLEDFASLTPNATRVSALTGEGMPELLAKIEAEIARQHERITVEIPYSEAALIARFYAVANVTSREETGDHVKLVGSLPPRYTSEFHAYRVR